MFANRFGLVASVLTVLTLGSTALFAFDADDAPPAASTAATEVAPDLELDAAAANWTHAGCIQLGSNCLDVFRDNKGNLWVCQACFTTENPGPGKCRKLTPWEILNALWCA